MNLRNTKLFLLLIIQLIYAGSLFSQENKKQLEIKKTENPPKIDGIISDNEWGNANVGNDFKQYVPYNGKDATQKTDIRFMYDDEALYVGIVLHDSQPDSIFKTLSKRDEDFDVNADVVVVEISTFNDGINTNLFMVTAAGVQTDLKGSSSNDDINWDAVWISEVNITDKGWVAEMKIPYSALRFSKEEEQLWGLNVWRKIYRKEEWSSWNWINNKIDGISNQAGELTGIKGIKPPLRLSFTPYFSSFIQHDSENDIWSKGIRGGMDLKYGINESFTLDLMLIPDFSQIQTDDQILNLSAFETQYQERRPFFTEATELFNKGNIFYSKRIGAFPKNGWDIYDDLNENEDVTVNPGETQIINATKVTGRNKNGLGIGFFNAMTLKSVGVIKDSISGAEREYTTQPFTNYNILVFDQNLKNNSYVSIINTNMFMPDTKYLSNVTAGDFKIKNNKQTYAFEGVIGVSQIRPKDETAEIGYKYDFELSKTGGNFRFELSNQLVNDLFNSNDMGYLRRNNYIQSGTEFSYQTLQPFWKILEYNSQLQLIHTMQYMPSDFMDFEIEFETFVKFKNFWNTGFYTGTYPFEQNDYYEPRVDGRFLKLPTTAFVGVFGGSDSRKALSFDVNLFYWNSFSEYNQRMNRINFGTKWRTNDKLRFNLELSYNNIDNSLGYVNDYNDSIFIGRRDRKTFNNALSVEFSFNTKSTLSLRMRHYWSSAKYIEYYTLNDNGYMDSFDGYPENHDINFNAFNIDMIYTWRFAPGSDILIVWKNAIYDEDEKVLNDYFENLNNTFSAPQTNHISLKILYYLDYLYLKKKSR